MTELIFKTISVNNRHHKNTMMNTVMIGTYNFETSVILKIFSVIMTKILSKIYGICSKL